MKKSGSQSQQVVGLLVDINVWEDSWLDSWDVGNDLKIV